MVRQRSPFADVLDLVSNMLAGAMVVAPRCALVQALRHARSALVSADLMICGWKPVADNDGHLVQLIIEDLEKHGAMEFSEDAQEHAVIQQSTIDAEVYRLAVANREWIVRITTEGGYGDDGTGTRECVEELLYGEVGRG